jgi:hypothetical protein
MPKLIHNRSRRHVKAVSSIPTAVSSEIQEKSVPEINFSTAFSVSDEITKLFNASILSNNPPSIDLSMQTDENTRPPSKLNNSTTLQPAHTQLNSDNNESNVIHSHPLEKKPTKLEKRREKHEKFMEKLMLPHGKHTRLITKNQLNKEKLEAKQINSFQDLTSLIQSVRGEDDKNKSNKNPKGAGSYLNIRQRARIHQSEQSQFNAVLQHSSFQSNPFGAIKNHLIHTIQQEKQQTHLINKQEIQHEKLLKEAIKQQEIKQQIAQDKHKQHNQAAKAAAFTNKTQKKIYSNTTRRNEMSLDQDFDY